jgi:hypothetical protein
MVQQQGGRAWVFAAARATEKHIEFVEWQSVEDASIIESETIAAALRDLNAAFPSEESDTWMEARL